MIFSSFMSRKATKDFIDNTNSSSCCYFYDFSPSMSAKFLEMENFFGFLFLNILHIFFLSLKISHLGLNFVCVSITHLVRFHNTFLNHFMFNNYLAFASNYTFFSFLYIFIIFFIINNRNKSYTIFLFINIDFSYFILYSFHCMQIIKENILRMGRDFILQN